MDASQYRLRVARDLHSRLGLNNVTYVAGLFEHTLHETLKTIGPVDFAFIDGHHQYRPTLDYTNAILDYAAPETILVYDDIRWSEGMKRAWAELKRDRRFQLVLDLNGMGVCVHKEGLAGRRVALPPIYHAFS